MSALRASHVLSSIGTQLPRLILVLALAVSGALVLMPPAGLGPAAAKAAPLALIAIALWATAAIPEFVTALIFFLLAMLFAVAPAPVVFSGFASTAFWLVFAGLVIGVAVQRTGLGARIADQSSCYVT